MWPSEYAKFESVSLKDDFIGFVRGDDQPPARPGRADGHQGHPPGEGGPPSCRAGWLSASTRGVTQATDLERLLRIIRNYPGNLDLFFTVSGMTENRRAVLKAGANLKVRHDEQLLREIEGAFGFENIRIVGHRGHVPSASGKPHLRPATPAPSAYGSRFPERAMDDDLN